MQDAHAECTSRLVVCQKTAGLFLELQMVVSHPGNAGRRSLVEAQHKNVIFNDLGTENGCMFLHSYRAEAEKQTCLKELCSHRVKHME